MDTSKQPLYPQQPTLDYQAYPYHQGEVPLQPMQHNPTMQQNVQMVAAPPPVPEVVHQHQERDRSKDDDSDDDSEKEFDQRSPGDVPQKYLNLEFEATFHEHKKTALIKPVNKVLGIVYKWIKLIIYHFFVFIIGIPLLILWAITNGITAFVYSWLWSPLLRITIFWLAAVMPLATMPLVSIFRPLVDVSARCLRQIRVKGDLTGKGFVQNV